ncbi:hypothetical protein BD289DRAFT_429819 [Coniella lustricola]|uniref:Secreted protein n=1 Tax=Coniella lustricola TaxID=2025994 RepID=A0A2T3ACN4_9PEZI|nr:hypothetical protein BD289DRAFT_429819 [Coniella lustricola]
MDPIYTLIILTALYWRAVAGGGSPAFHRDTAKNERLWLEMPRHPPPSTCRLRQRHVILTGNPSSCRVAVAQGLLLQPATKVLGLICQPGI